MLIIKIHETNIEQVLYLTVDILKNGGIVVYPTETFYGLGVKFDMEDSLKKLYNIKQRPEEKAMPLIIGNKGLLSVVAASINDMALLLMDRFWPGPLTLIFLAKENLSEYITAGTHTIAVRIPGESFALQLAKTANFPITATSANPSGLPPAQDAASVIKYFGDKVDLIIDGGHTSGGLPSTIVDVTGDKIKILREGVIKKELLTL
ncbi:MAG: threonylcarbamoyl-AMP synthase [Nitrospirae bacterium CG_4_10_14_0_8_um_filter_41_23]|nr:threonylcarbamoyl-AMP synthase [Nitrospirota bacterium]PIQ95201.1 MAG: threonylcarbamoyl-AMP synthase [Nitrospirae bacterium CG11_big_fil_rev_8_21_14_0_20_41_14]PIV41423.1 MAG: threonylcarbamoyl-AMP synthase [Nitrospirae bacterium CG02_land_8_20_14_3_00_41_53]PIW87655.1 MAG: threonylcarbamoyl-AMP synthase [Nitrospirae bacterium CG_4_8_14_3_um_filter_41_47]PIY87642.1 MAG: threonylcarbamoyl-AMP synthase [Nitrospirae bacterium CG_4_10_14_0_8_um_filter_41_23]PJA80788.1 MAG: threonylcarbamoyl-AM